jgi:hypothetical protein
VIIADSATGSPQSVTLTGTIGTAAACKSTVGGAIAYTDLKSQKVSLPYGTPFAITGGTADVQLAGGALNGLITPQSVAGSYVTSDGVRGDIALSPISGTTWTVNVGKLSPDTSVSLSLQFAGAIAPAIVQSILDGMLTDPAYQAGFSQFVDNALGKTSAVQTAAANVLSQAAAAVVTSELSKKGLTPKSPDDLKTALGSALLSKIEPIFNVTGSAGALQNQDALPGVLGLSADDFKALSPQQLYDKLKGVTDFSKIADPVLSAAVLKQVTTYLKTYQNAASAVNDGLKNALFTGTSSLAVGSDEATDVSCDLQKYAGFDVGALYSFRLSELRSFFVANVYFGSVQLRPGAPQPKPGPGEWLRQRVSLAFGVALADLSSSSSSKISGENAFVYGLGVRINKYFRITAGGLLYRTTLPAVNGSTSPANGSLRQEFFIGPSIDITALSALQSIFAKAKSN